ncbi:RIIa domain-containing protein 1-like isoform X1 [Labeo rohita]|uniref:RIIa domain-containing protein 1-like isoform X1 n=1 Tax=Labeo rohita TaxID=84645 RepID=UPI0021E2B627|nr:RIIa domain-containing protein 1-like isoform X1 [Labeo rohita]
MAERNTLQKLDFSALSPEQQEKLHHFKVKTRVANEKYLRSHPEVEMLLSDFLRCWRKSSQAKAFKVGTLSWLKNPGLGWWKEQKKQKIRDQAEIY